VNRAARVQIHSHVAGDGQRVGGRQVATQPLEQRVRDNIRTIAEGGVFVPGVGGSVCRPGSVLQAPPRAAVVP